MTVVVFDRFHRGRLLDASGLAHELPETHEPIRSPAPSGETSPEEVLLRLYCNTLEDERGTPYHYEWIASEGSVPPVPEAKPAKIQKTLETITACKCCYYRIKKPIAVCAIE